MPGRAIAPTKTALPPARDVSGVGGRPLRIVGKAASDPRFAKVMQQIELSAVKLKTHPNPTRKAAEAQAAAQPAPKEALAGALAGKIDEMKDAKTAKPESNSFLATLRAEIEKVMPQTNDAAEKFMEGGEKQQLKGAVAGNVNQQTDAAAGPLKTTSEQPPDTGSVPAKEVQALPGEPAPSAPPVAAGDAMPAPRPAAEVDATRDQTKQDSDNKMAEAEITPEQMQKANDPRFSKVADKKATVAKVAEAGPGKFKSGEQKVLTEAVSKAQGVGNQSMTAFVATKAQSGTAVKSRQQAAKERDEARRKEVTGTIESIFNDTKAKVEHKLASLEGDVTALFDSGADAALNKMKADSQREIKKFKDERYSGVVGAGRWIADLFRPAHPEIKRILERSRQAFSRDMDTVIVGVANMVDRRLQEAKSEIDRGQARIKSYVDTLPRDLQGVGRAAQQEVSGRFDELRTSVDEKKNDLAQKLAQRYKEATDKADAELKKIEDANKGALSGLLDAIGEVVKVLTEFKNKLMSILRKGMDTIKLIIADPIKFLGNLLAAVKGGIQQFVANIWTHLKRGFMQWLFGALASAGVEIPADLSLPSILKLVLGVLGITYDRMRQKAVKLIGERNVRIIEKLVEYLRALITGGPAALWEKVKEDLGNLKQMVIDAIQNWLIETVVKQAVTKIVSMFNPAGAIVQAVIAIYNIVMFVVERAQQIMAFVEAVVNSVHAIATGAIGGAINWIAQALGRTIPLVIGFLARLIGLGGISQKIKEFITKVQSKVDQAIDKVIAKIVDVVRKLFGRGGGNTAAGAASQDKPIDADQPLKFGVEGHTLRFHYENQKVVVQMASGSFGQLQSRLDQIVSSLTDPIKAIDPNASSIKKVENSVNKIKKMVDRSEKDAERDAKKLPPSTGASNPRATFIASEAHKTSLNVNKELDTLADIFTSGKTGKQLFGNAAKLKIGDTVLTTSSSPKSMVITQIKKFTEYGGKFELLFNAETADRSYKSGFLYREEAVKWSLAKKPPFRPFTPGPPNSVQIDKANLNSGSGASHTPSWFGKTLAGRTFAARGHLVAKVFGGPGGADNIVPITTKANNQMNHGIESRLAKDIRLNDTVYVYKVHAVYPGGDTTKPPDRIIVVEEKIYPKKTGPSTTSIDNL